MLIYKITQYIKMEIELRKYLSEVISDNLSITIDYNAITLDPYVLVFLLPTWTSRSTKHVKNLFIQGKNVFQLEYLYPELDKLTDKNDRNYVMEIYRNELYTLYNIIEYYSMNMIDRNMNFRDIMDEFTTNTCSNCIITLEDYIKINDRGILYYIPYETLIEYLSSNINHNPFTNEAYSNVIYESMLHKYRIELMMLN